MDVHSDLAPTSGELLVATRAVAHGFLLATDSQTASTAVAWTPLSLSAKDSRRAL